MIDNLIYFKRYKDKLEEEIVFQGKQSRDYYAETGKK